MRLLVTAILSCILLNNVNADEVCKANSIVTSDILSCLEDDYKRIDEQLNSQYKITKERLGGTEKNLLAETETDWIRFKNLSCDYIYKSYSPGTESEIERMSCLTTLSSARLMELIYIDSGIMNDGFYTATSIAGNLSEKFKDEFLRRIKDKHNDTYEQGYFDKNCRLTERLHSEDFQLCMIRMQFQNYTR